MSPNREVTHGQHRQRVRRRSSDDLKIADGIAKALRETDDDVRMAAKGWSKDIEKGLGKPTVEVDADTKSAKKEIEKVEKGRYTAKVKVDVDLAKASRQKTGNIYLPGDTAVVPTPSRMNGSAINGW